MELSAYSTTEFTVPPFDFTAQGEGSNQRGQTGTFRMQVRRVVTSGFYHSRMSDTWNRSLAVEGRRYKPDGALGALRAFALVRASDLPPEIWVAIRDHVPAELHPGGGA